MANLAGNYVRTHSHWHWFVAALALSATDARATASNIPRLQDGLDSSTACASTLRGCEPPEASSRTAKSLVDSPPARILLAARQRTGQITKPHTKIGSHNNGKVEVHRDNAGKITYRKSYLEKAEEDVTLLRQSGARIGLYAQGDKAQAAASLANTRLEHEAYMMRRAALFGAAPNAEDRRTFLMMESGGITVEQIAKRISAEHENNRLSVDDVRAATKYLYQAGLAALAKLQNSGIVHTDPHIGNVVLDKDLVPRLIDFDTAKLAGEREQAQYDRLLYDHIGGSPQFAHETVWDAQSGGMGNGRPLDGKKSYTNYATDAYYFVKSLQANYLGESSTQYGGEEPALKTANELVGAIKHVSGAASERTGTLIKRIVSEELAALGAKPVLVDQE